MRGRLTRALLVGGVAAALFASCTGVPARAAADDDEKAPKLIGELVLPDKGTLGGFDIAPAAAAARGIAGRDKQPKWTLEQSAKAPRDGLRAPAGTASGADATVVHDTTPGDPAALRKAGKLAAQGNEAAAAAVDTRDLFTWEQCEKNDPGGSLQQKVVLRNHYALCVVARPEYVFKVCEDGGCRQVGKYTYRLTVLGEGTKGGQKMYLTGRYDDWKQIGVVDPAAIMSAGFDCLNIGTATCSQLNPVGRTDTLAGWMVNGFFGEAMDATGSPAANDAVHFPVDGVNYHEFSLWQMGSEGLGTFRYPFRCDNAKYVNGGACIFHDIDAVITYPLRNGGVDSVAEHIKKAQDDPEHTFPGGVGIDIPGEAHSDDPPLTRLYPKMDADSKTYYDANHTRAVATCNLYEPLLRGGGRQCDEYPFRSTYEGANFRKNNGGSKWWYSAKMLNGKENGRAGSLLGAWYKRDNILAADPFWVEITEDGSGAGPAEDDSPPMVDAGDDVAGPEGAAVQLSGSASDAENEGVPTSWSVEPVSGVDAGATCSFAAEDDAGTTVSCTDDGVFRLTLTADDGVNAPVSDSATLTVSNVDPTFGGTGPRLTGKTAAGKTAAEKTAAGTTAAAPTGLLTEPWTLYRIGSDVTLSTPFDDPGSNDTQECVVDWDDGTPPQTYAAHDKTCDATHRFTQAGMFTITLTNTDDDGGDDAWTTMVVVYDPDAGWANADGSVPSAPGYWTANPDASGEEWWHLAAHYYKPDDTRPKGDARTWLPGTSWRFDTSSDTGVDWLVVTPDGKIASKGHGKVAGLSGEYGYVFYGYDGCANGQTPHCIPGPDKFRVVVWPLAEGAYPTGNAVYDNRAAASYDVDRAEPQSLLSGIVTIQRP